MLTIARPAYRTKLLAILALGAVFSLPHLALADAGGPSVTNGAALFASNCASCHGSNGAGGKKFGSAVAADLQAPGLEKTYHGSDKLLLRAIMLAKDEDGERLDHPMPAWNGKLTVAEAKDIIAYLHTLHS